VEAITEGAVGVGNEGKRQKAKGLAACEHSVVGI
jgi:hypothetical protein